MRIMITFDWALALALTAALLAGCAREMDPVEAGESQEDVVVTLTTRVSLGNTSTKAVNGDGVKTFAVGDQIAVVYTNTSTATVKATSQALTSGDISNSGKSAQFTVSLINPVDGDVRYVYPASMVNDSGNMTSLASQDGTLAGLQAFDYAEGSGEMTSTVLPSYVALENQLAVGKFTLKDYTGTTDLTGITSLKVFCDRRCYTVTSASSFADTIYVAMNPIADKAVSFKASDGTNTYWKMVPSATLEASNIYPVNVTMGYPGVLPGEFSVSATEQVHFSQGNLQYIGSASTPYWKFAENQLTYLGEANASSETNVDRDLFGWGTKTAPYQTSDNGVDYSWAEWGENVISNGGNAENVGWYTLPDAGWDYMLSLNSEGRQGDRFVKATVDGVCGLIIFPDGWAGDRPFASKNTENVSFSSNSVTLPDWENNLEPYGAVFLPNAGRRSGVSVSVSSTSGYYWTSTPYHESNIYQASALNLFDSLLAFAYITRATGYSVRLVLASETISSLPTTINLSTVTNDTVIPDGYVVKGTLGVNKKISIAAGATVTLDGVSINADGTFTTGNYAGITCLGDATIVLNGTNSVTGFDGEYPGIYVPVGSKLIIQGPGTLNASSNANSDGNSAGIGAGGQDIHCGSIEIQGGVINATGAGDGAGIGSSFQSTCEGITISGGTITATGSEGAPGIGSGNQGGVGDITITSDVIKVTAIKGPDSPNSIGRGEDAGCGTVKFGNATVYDGSDWTASMEAGNYGGLTLAISTTTNDDDTWTLTPIPVKWLSAATAEDVGKLAGQNGEIYDNAAAATAAGTTAVAKIIYVGSSTGASSPYTHGLALALADESKTTWADAQTACDGKNSSAPVTGASWMLPSEAQWETMISAAGNYTTLRDGFNSVGGTNIQKDYYWSSTSSSSSQARAYYFNQGFWGVSNKTGNCVVRACLVF